jgi:hypothetical protein
MTAVEVPGTLEVFAPPTVVEALAAVIAAMPSIGKGGQASEQQGGYAYRGIEQITQHAAPLLAKHGIVFAPNVVSMETRDLVVNNKPWTDTILTVEYRIHGPAGDHITATVVGIGRDNSDKGANKALTQAFKYALTQVLCIADGKDDADGDTHEADAPAPLPPPDGFETIEQAKEALDALTTRVSALDSETLVEFRAWKDMHEFPYPYPSSAVDAMNAELDRLEQASEPFE